jgi:fimbrial chaperone protein
VTRAIVMFALWATALLFPVAAVAQGFSALVSPPRFEAASRAGETYRGVIEITNVSTQPSRYMLRTADWTLEADGSVKFSDALAAGSCRPWVGIEAAELVLQANAKRRYRFEVAVPADAVPGECRFAILIEGEPEQVPGKVSLPIAGRIGVIVYLAIDDAAPRLEIVGHGVEEVGGQRLPVVHVRNGGNAHGRLAGLVNGRDASGRRYAFAPSSLPILPGETRTIALTPEADAGAAAAPELVHPVALEGHLDAGRQRLDVAEAPR